MNNRKKGAPDNQAGAGILGALMIMGFAVGAMVLRYALVLPRFL